MKNRFERSGDIREVDLLAALVALWREKASVTLDFRRAGVAGGFDIADGDVVATFSADPRFENAAILVRAGKLESAALDRLAAPEGSDRAMAAMQAGVLTRREWKWGEKIRAIEVLSDLLTWNDGRYLAEPDTRSVSGEFRLPIPRLVLELFLRSRDRALVDHQLGSPDAPLERSVDFEQEFATFGLTADAESVVHLIDGRATARQIASKAPADTFAVEKLLAALVTLGLLNPLPVEASPAATVRLDAEPPDESPAPDVAAERDPLDAEIEGTAADDFPEVRYEPEPELRYEPEPEPEAEPELAPEPAPLESRFDAVERFEANTLDAGPASAELPSGAAEWDTLASEPPDPILDRTAEPDSDRTGRRQGPILLAVFGALAVAVAAVLVIRSWPASTTPVPPAPTAIAAAPTAVAEAVRPTEAAPVTVPTPHPTAAKARAVQAPTAVPARPTAAPPPTKAAPAAPARAVPTARPAAPPAGPERKPWLDRAESDRRRLAAEPNTRYAVQLLLACEVPTLSDAWKHDQPSGSLWLQTTDHQGRTCFRVFWGRFGTAEEARRAKDRVPGHFVTRSNHPAVVGVR